MEMNYPRNQRKSSLIGRMLAVLDLSSLTPSAIEAAKIEAEKAATVQRYRHGKHHGRTLGAFGGCTRMQRRLRLETSTAK